MSASQQKKKRQSQPAGGQTPARSGSRAPWILGGIGAALLVVLAIFFAMVGSGFFQKHTTAAAAGSHKISPVMYNYFFQDAYYQSYASYVTDANTPLSQQYYDQEAGVTWADYLQEQADSSIARTYALYDAAVADGYVLSEADAAAVDAQLETLSQTAASSGVSASAYLAGAYGQGANTENFREYVELLQLTGSYLSAHAESLEYSGEEIQAYYEAHQDTLDTVSYRSFLCSVESDETDEDGNPVIDGSASEAMAREMAEASQGSEETFSSLAYDNASESSKSYYEDDSATLHSNQAVSEISDSLRSWLTDPARQSGDTTALEDESGGWTAVLFLDNASKYDVNVVNVRHILIQPAGSEEAASSAQALLDQFLSGDQTEASFAELAKANSADSNAAEGGLYENVYPGQNVPAFNDWCFDAARQPGDTGIVETDYGYHVMYFVGEGGVTAREYRTVSAMQTEDTNAWADGLASAVAVEHKGFGMRFTKLK